MKIRKGNILLEKGEREAFNNKKILGFTEEKVNRLLSKKDQEIAHLKGFMYDCAKMLRVYPDGEMGAIVKTRLENQATKEKERQGGDE